MPNRRKDERNQRIRRQVEMATAKVTKKHDHNWGVELHARSGCTLHVRCSVCGLCVEVYQNHVSIWDYSRLVDGSMMLGCIDLPEQTEEIVSA